MRQSVGVVSLAVFVSAFPQQRAAPAKRLEQALTVRADPPKLIPVVVGGPQDLFVPNQIKANVGDVVQFQFSNGNHTVTQSTEKAGCQPLQAANPQAVHSGHIPFIAGQKDVGTFIMPVTSTDAMFLYCATGPHCQTGQVMVVNPTSDTQLANYVKVSMAAKKNVDGAGFSGGIPARMPLAAALFTPAPPEQKSPPATPPSNQKASKLG
ncbi:Extracellular serine-rich protein [Tolypocladium paradoxum]|uniref:Extracellular serine-rich protein n=1 Tax=Tolypocladium paradoxum TaxID=94208 RepID=A0A2S4KZ10_9HYPO|nr:Extracellular serine-rich protein [Tolypocladium paradoxum]